MGRPKLGSPNLHYGLTDSDSWISDSRLSDGSARNEVKSKLSEKFQSDEYGSYSLADTDDQPEKKDTYVIFIPDLSGLKFKPKGIGNSANTSDRLSNLTKRNDIYKNFNNPNSRDKYIVLVGVIDDSRNHTGISGYSDTVSYSFLFRMLMAKGYDPLQLFRGDSGTRRKYEKRMGMAIMKNFENGHFDVVSNRASLSKIADDIVADVRDFISGGDKVPLSDATINRREYKKKKGLASYPNGINEPLSETGQLERAIGAKVISYKSNTLRQYNRNKSIQNKILKEKIRNELLAEKRKRELAAIAKQNKRDKAIAMKMSSRKRDVLDVAYRYIKNGNIKSYAKALALTAGLDDSIYASTKNRIQRKIFRKIHKHAYNISVSVEDAKKILSPELFQIYKNDYLLYTKKKKARAKEIEKNRRLSIKNRAARERERRREEKAIQVQETAPVIGGSGTGIKTVNKANQIAPRVGLSKSMEDMIAKKIKSETAIAKKENEGKYQSAWVTEDEYLDALLGKFLHGLGIDDTAPEAGGKKKRAKATNKGLGKYVKFSTGIPEIDKNKSTLVSFKRFATQNASNILGSKNVKLNKYGNVSLSSLSEDQISSVVKKFQELPDAERGRYDKRKKNNIYGIPFLDEKRFAFRRRYIKDWIESSDTNEGAEARKIIEDFFNSGKDKRRFVSYGISKMPAEIRNKIVGLFVYEQERLTGKKIDDEGVFDRIDTALLGLPYRDYIKQKEKLAIEKEEKTKKEEEVYEKMAIEYYKTISTKEGEAYIADLIDDMNNSDGDKVLSVTKEEFLKNHDIDLESIRIIMERHQELLDAADNIVDGKGKAEL